jgi:hypothetical protein
MMDETMIIEDQRAMELTQNQLATEREAEPTEEGEGAAKPKAEHFINSGEAVLLLAFTGSVEIIQWILDMVPYAGWIVNGGISFFVGFIIYIWLSGKIARGAPKKWLKAIYYGAAGGAIPIIPGYCGAIIYLIYQDRQFLGKVAGKIVKLIEKI